MSDEQLQLQIAKRINKEEENKKNVAWGKLGVQIYYFGIKLELQAQEIAKQLINPTTSDLIKQAEEANAVVNKQYKELQQERIIITNKFTPVIERLSSYEKALLQSIQNNQAAILKAKQDLKEAEKTKEAKAKELKDVEHDTLVYVANMHASYLAAQLKLLATAYEHALNTAIPLEDLPVFKAKLCARVNLNNTVTLPPKPIAKYNTQDVIDAEVLKHFKPWQPQQYVDGFAADVEAKFSDWEQALKNKEAAKELNDKEISLTTAAIDDQLQKQKVAAGLEALAVPIAEQTGVKPLKEVWQIAEPQTIDDTFAIINAFAVNRNLVQDAITKIKPINFGIKQMIAALVKVKTDDVNFECTGIVFTKIEKL